MKVKNRTGMWQRCGNLPARPWRTIEVPDGTQVDENVFEILDKKIETKKKMKKEFNE